MRFAVCIFLLDITHFFQVINSISESNLYDILSEYSVIIIFDNELYNIIVFVCDHSVKNSYFVFSIGSTLSS